MTAKRRDTTLEAAGAEFLVLGSLLAEGIPAYKAYTNFPGYDVVAWNADSGRVCKIQVKSAFVIGTTGFPLKISEGFDFLCFIRLNVGRRGKGRVSLENRQPPEIFVFPKVVIDDAWRQASVSGVNLSRISEPSDYLFRWDMIRTFLGL